jgi:hypothetical protein
MAIKLCGPFFQVYFVPILNKSTAYNLEVVRADAKAPSLLSLVKLTDGAEAIVAVVGCEYFFIIDKTVSSLSM